MGVIRVALAASLGLVEVAWLGLVEVACHAHPPPAPPPPARVKLAVLPAESDGFPAIAKATTDALVAARVTGIDDTQVSKVSLEVVQLSIECVDASDACYQAVGKSLAANVLLFADIAEQAKKQVKVTITLFDVATSHAKHTAEKVFASEAAANAGIADLVAEATR